MDERIKKTRYIYMYFIICRYIMAEYYSAIKKEILPFGTWLKLKGIVLSEISQKEKTDIV